MRKTLISNIRLLLLSVLATDAMWSCQDEKPQIITPIIDPVIPVREFKHVETITPDTLTFNEGDSAVFQIRTIPADLLSRDSVTVQIADTAGARYEFAEIKSYTFDDKDSLWNIVMKMTFGMQSGDRISIMLADGDTVIYSDETVLNRIPLPEPEVKVYSLDILTDSIAAFVKESKTTYINLRVSPWDILFNDSTGRLTVTDLYGSPLSAKKIVANPVKFVPRDSTWTINIDIISNLLSSSTVLVKVETPDTVMVSYPIKIKRVTVSMTSVKTGNDVAMKYNDVVGTYYLFRPEAKLDYTAQNFLFSHDGDKVTVNGQEMKEGEYNTVDATKPIIASVWKYNAHKDYRILLNTGLPIVRIDTKGQSVRDRINWVEGASMTIEDIYGNITYEGSLALRGRGNGTWDFPKKPYALRLDEKAKILGMHKHRRWILLANYKDRTLLRNDAALWISRQTDLPYTISGQYVELVWNGVHQGNYYLCEQARIDNHRIDTWEPNLEDPASGGYFVEIDALFNYYSNKPKDVGFWSKKFNLPYIFKDPDSDDINASSPAFKYFMDMVDSLETILKSDYRVRRHQYEKYLDADKAIDFALIQELTMNHDAYNTWPKNGPHSTFIYVDTLGKMCFGPIWDFDYHTFMPSCYVTNPDDNKSYNLAREWNVFRTSAKTKTGKYYYEYLLKDPQFQQKVVERWNRYKYTWQNGFNDYIDMMADKIRISESINWTRWGGKIENTDQNLDQTLKFQEAVDKMKEGFKQRWEWIDTYISAL